MFLRSLLVDDAAMIRERRLLCYLVLGDATKDPPALFALNGFPKFRGRAATFDKMRKSVMLA